MRRSPLGDGVDRMAVGRQVALRIVFGAGAFAQHVAAEAECGLLSPLCVGLTQRLFDRTTEHELAAEQLDRPHRGGDHRLSAQPLDQPGGTRLRIARQEILSQRDRLRRQAGQQGVMCAVVVAEVSVPELVCGERDGGLGVGHAQQRFGQPHQRQPFGAGNRVLPQQRLQRPERGRLVAHRLHPGPRLFDDARPIQHCLHCRGEASQHVELGASRVRQAGAFGRSSEGG